MSKALIIFVIVLAVAVIIYQTQSDGTDISDDLDLDDTDGGTMSLSSLVSAMAAAIQTQENVALFHNNPYALTAGAADQVGADYTPNTTGGVVVNFDTLDDGIAAGQQFISEFLTDHSGLTLSQAIATYIQGPNAASTISGNYPASVQNYIAGVASALGVSPTSTIGSLIGQ